MNWKPTKLSFICSKHFKDEDFITKKSENTRAKLKKDAVPSIFDFPKHLIKEKKVDLLLRKGKLLMLRRVESYMQCIRRMYCMTTPMHVCRINKTYAF